jgi:hypothetical protein
MKSIKNSSVEIPRFSTTITSKDAEEQLGFNPREFYKEVFASLKKDFAKGSLAYTQITNGIDADNLTGSNFFFNTYLNSKLREKFPNKSVIILKDIEGILNTDASFFSVFYTDTPQVVLRTAKDESWRKNNRIVKSLIEQIGNKYEFSSKNPLIITNPKLVRDSSGEYRVSLEIDENTQLTNDSRLASGNSEIKLAGGIEKRLWTKPTGLSRLYIYDNDLNSSKGNLENSDSGGRVVIINKI